MKYQVLTTAVLLSMLSGSGAIATAAETVAAPTAGQVAVETTQSEAARSQRSVWAKGLRGPQGIARDAQGNIYVAEYTGGQLARFAPDGTQLGKIGEGLKSPAWVERVGDTLYITERKANRILRLNNDGTLSPVAGAVEEPLGLGVDPQGRLLVVSHTTSRLLALQPGAKIVPFNPNAPGPSTPVLDTFMPLYAPSAQEGKRYGYRNVAADRDGTIFFTDETEGQLMLLTPGGRVATWVKGLDDPTAVVISPRGEVFVAEEGAGRVSRISAEGVATIVADGLGQPRDIEFLDDKTVLVSDRQGGIIWKVILP